LSLSSGGAAEDRGPQGLDLLNLGHRGAAGHLPENTIPGFHKAVELGADGFELDVRLTADARLVVVHGLVVNGRAVQTSPYAELRNAQQGFQIPLLDEVLEAFGRRVFLDIELKAPGFEAGAIGLIEKYCDMAQVLVSSFHPATLLKVRQLTPDLQVGFIYNRTQEEGTRHNCPVDVIKPQFRLASRDLINQAHAEGLRVFAWTVNDAHEAGRLMELGIDGLITDYPEMVAGLAGRSAA